jgi:hypothetical protein
MKKADIITFNLIKRLESTRQGFVIPSFFIGTFECDVFLLTKAGYTEEYEIKTSIADYKNDYNKRISEWNETKKHDKVKNGELANRFYFVVPESIIGEVEFPNYVGVMTYKRYDDYDNDKSIDYYLFNEAKEAPLLHKRKEKIDTKNIIHTIAQRCYFRFIQERNKRIKN